MTPRAFAVLGAVAMAVVSCGSVALRPDAGGGGAGGGGQGAADAHQEHPGTISVEGTIGSLGGVAVSGTVRIFDDGFEGGEKSCATNICVTGAITP